MIEALANGKEPCHPNREPQVDAAAGAVRKAFEGLDDVPVKN